MIPGQIDMPTPAADSLWSKIVGPLEGPLGGAFWFLLHVVVPGAIIVGIAGMVFAGVTGNKSGMTRARGAIVAIPLALVLAGVAVIVANWAVSSYA